MPLLLELPALLFVLRVGVDQVVAEGVIVEVFQPGLQIALLLVEEALAVRDQVAQVPDLGRVDGGEVDLGQPSAASKSKPTQPGARSCGSDTGRP
jgi:hypothetical protein